MSNNTVHGAKIPKFSLWVAYFCYYQAELWINIRYVMGILPTVNVSLKKKKNHLKVYLWGNCCQFPCHSFLSANVLNVCCVLGQVWELCDVASCVLDRQAKGLDPADKFSKGAWCAIPVTHWSQNLLLPPHLPSLLLLPLCGLVNQMVFLIQCLIKSFPLTYPF